ISSCGGTCAKSQSASSATARLRAWPATRSSDAPPAEETTVRPRPSVSARAAISGPSMRPTIFSKRRLIIFLVVPGLELRLPLGHLAEEVIVENLARDRAGG